MKLDTKIALIGLLLALPVAIFAFWNSIEKIVPQPLNRLMFGDPIIFPTQDAFNLRCEEDGSYESCFQDDSGVSLVIPADIRNERSRRVCIERLESKIEFVLDSDDIYNELNLRSVFFMKDLRGVSREDSFVHNAASFCLDPQQTAAKQYAPDIRFDPLPGEVWPWSIFFDAVAGAANSRIKELIITVEAKLDDGAIYRLHTCRALIDDSAVSYLKEHRRYVLVYCDSPKS